MAAKKSLSDFKTRVVAEYRVPDGCHCVFLGCVEGHTVYAAIAERVYPESADDEDIVYEYSNVLESGVTTRLQTTENPYYRLFDGAPRAYIFTSVPLIIEGGFIDELIVYLRFTRDRILPSRDDLLYKHAMEILDPSLRLVRDEDGYFLRRYFISYYEHHSFKFALLNEEDNVTLPPEPDEAPMTEHRFDPDFARDGGYVRSPIYEYAPNYIEDLWTKVIELGGTCDATCKIRLDLYAAGNYNECTLEFTRDRRHAPVIHAAAKRWCSIYGKGPIAFFYTKT